MFVRLGGLYQDRFCIPPVGLARRANDRQRRDAADRQVFVRYGEHAVISSFTGALRGEGLSRREGVRLLHRLLNSFLARSVMFVLQGFNEDGPDRVLGWSRGERVRLVVDRRVSSLANVHWDCHLQDTSGGDTYRDRHLRSDRVGVAHTQEGIGRRVVRFAPENVTGRLFRHVTDRSAAPRHDLVKISGRTGERWLRAMFLGEGGRITAIGAFNVQAHILRLGRFQRE